jgi:hypothetical protein
MVCIYQPPNAHVRILQSSAMAAGAWKRSISWFCLIPLVVECCPFKFNFTTVRCCHLSLSQNIIFYVCPTRLKLISKALRRIHQHFIQPWGDRLVRSFI